MTAKRVSAGAIALLVLGALVLRIWLRMDQQDETLGQAIWALYRFFTIWTNTLVGVVAACVAIGQKPTASLQTGLLLSISIVAIVYHALLAKFNDYAGLDWVADHLVHTVIPLAYAVYWLMFVRKSQLRLSQLPYWLILPLVYCIFAMTRGALDGVYPYFFLNLADLGFARTALNVFGLLVAFAGIGAVLVFAGRALHRAGLSD